VAGVDVQTKGLPVLSQDRARLSAHSGASGSPESPKAHFQESYYTVPEIAKAWKLSRDVVRKLFKDEPGVFVLGNDHSRGKRGYQTLRIPEIVMQRVHRRMCNP
jgi:hypothetical protein